MSQKTLKIHSPQTQPRMWHGFHITYNHNGKFYFYFNGFQRIWTGGGEGVFVYSA
jgi:hypothetical protein